MPETATNYLAVIKVVGIGGGGTNAVNRMVDAGLKGVEFIAVNTDAQALLMTDADVKAISAATSPVAWGAGANPEVGREGGTGEPGRHRRIPQRGRHGLYHRWQGRGPAPGHHPSWRRSPRRAAP